MGKLASLPVSHYTTLHVDQIPCLFVTSQNAEQQLVPFVIPACIQMHNLELISPWVKCAACCLPDYRSDASIWYCKLPQLTHVEHYSCGGNSASMPFGHCCLPYYRSDASSPWGSPSEGSDDEGGSRFRVTPTRLPLSLYGREQANSSNSSQAGPLSRAVLCCAVLCCAVLRRAVLNCAAPS